MKELQKEQKRKGASYSIYLISDGFADFGLTKLVNKAKKNDWENLLIDRDVLSYRKAFSSDKLRTANVLGIRKSGKRVFRGDNRFNIRSRADLPELTRKPKSGELVPRSTFEKEMIPDNKNFTDIRRTNDTALSRSGYMGYKNTPNSFFEEAIPNIETGRKIKVKPRVYY